MAKDDDSSLAQRIVSLKAELELVTQDIVSHVSSLYNPENDAAINLKNDPRNAIKVLQHEVLDCLETAQERGAYRERFAADVEQCRTLMDTISQVASASDKVVRCDEAVGGADLQLARKLLAEVRQALDALPAPNTEVGTGAVCRVLRREARLLNARFHAKLRRLLSNCIVCECGRLSVTKRLKGMLRGGGEEMILDVGIELADIWACLVSIDSAEESVRGVVDSVWQAVLKPLWRERRAQAPHVVLGDEHSELVFDSVVRDHSLSAAGGGGGGGAGAVLPGACRMPLPQLLEQVGQVWSFVATEVFTGHVGVVALAAAQLEPAGALPLVPMLVDTLTALVPKSEGELAGFQRAAEKASKDLEAKLSALGLLQGSDSFSSSSSSSSRSSRSRSSRLSDSVSELRHRFADMRRKEILGRGRDLLLSDYHNTMVAAGDASEDEPSSAGNVGDPTAMLEHSGSVSLKTLQFESCQVSLAACRVLKLVHEVMRQACQSGTSPSLATMLYQSARDCLELFLAIVPVRFADVIDTVPRMGAVLYNDCCYVAHNCTLITHAYKADLTKIDPTLSDSAGFIDFIPRFRALGEKCLAGHLDEQRATLGELVARVRVSPASERSKKQGSVSAGMLAPRVVGAVGMVGAAVGGALLKQIGTLSGVGGGGGYGSAGNGGAGGQPAAGGGPAHTSTFVGGNGGAGQLIITYTVVTTGIKTYNGLLVASTKTVNGVLIANVKTWNGLV